MALPGVWLSAVFLCGDPCTVVRLMAPTNEMVPYVCQCMHVTMVVSVRVYKLCEW